MHTNDIAFAAQVEAETAKLTRADVEALTLEIVAGAGDNAFAQTRKAIEEARADGDAAQYALWQEIQTEIVEWGPTGKVYA